MIDANDFARWALHPDARRELEALRKVAEAAREVTSWDWSGLLVHHPDSETVVKDVSSLEHALEAVPQSGTGEKP